MKFYEVVRHNRRLKSEQTPFYRGGKIGKISFFIAVAKSAKSFISPCVQNSVLLRLLYFQETVTRLCKDTSRADCSKKSSLDLLLSTKILGLLGFTQVTTVGPFLSRRSISMPKFYLYGGALKSLLGNSIAVATPRPVSA